jgi:hypothetical protein
MQELCKGPSIGRTNHAVATTKNALQSFADMVPLQSCKAQPAWSFQHNPELCRALQRCKAAKGRKNPGFLRFAALQSFAPPKGGE